MILFPTAKINIGLYITEKRADGFHNIETVFYPVPLCDALEFVESDNQFASDTLTVSGIESIGKPEDNLIIKAVKRLREIKNFPILKLHLHKAIPAGAGLGGGSSNAAFLLKGVNSFYGLDLTDKELKEIALELGSDCPFFIDAVPAHALGRGELLAPLKTDALNNYYLVLAKPDKCIDTKAAYMNCCPKPAKISLNSVFEYVPVAQWKCVVYNDFDEYAFGEEPLIAQLIDEMYSTGAVFSLMSGSGSTVYGIFKNKPQLSDMLKKLLIWQGYIVSGY